MTRVLIHTSAPQRHIATLTNAMPDVKIEAAAKNSELPRMLDSFQPDAMFTVNITSDAPFPQADVLACQNLKWVSVGGSGTDHVAPWEREKLTVTNSAGVAADMMAEYAIGCFVHFNIDVAGLMADKTARVWDAQRRVKPLAGQTLLVVGLGNTGRAISARAKAFGMTVIGTRATPRATPNCDEVHAPQNLPQLWPRADYIAICTPRLASTQGLVGPAAFALMKPDAVLVNVARGGVVSEPDLIAALGEGRLRGAAMDVFASEPLPEGDPIWSAPNLLISPHCSAVYEGWETRSFSLFCENLARFVQGEQLFNIVDPERGY